MRRSSKLFLLLAPLAITFASCENNGSPSAEKGGQLQEISDEQEIRNQIERYIDAINRRNLDEIPQFWSPKSVYRNPITGNLVQGREGIKTEFKNLFDQYKDFKVQFKAETIRFPVDGKAAEEGVSVLSIPGREPLTSKYKMIHVKQDGKWLIMHVSQLDFGMVN